MRASARIFMQVCQVIFAVWEAGGLICIGGTTYPGAVAIIVRFAITPCPVRQTLPNYGRLAGRVIAAYRGIRQGCNQ